MPVFLKEKDNSPKTLYDTLQAEIIPASFAPFLDIHTFREKLAFLSNDWAPVFDIALPTTIKIADAVLSKQPAIREIALSEFLNQITKHPSSPTFTWTESLLVPEKLKFFWETFCHHAPIFTQDPFNNNYTAIEKKLDHHFHNSSFDLVIAKINDTVGYGVFTLNPIPKHAIVSIYTGRLKSEIGLHHLFKAKYTFCLPANSLLFYGMDEVNVILQDPIFQIYFNFSSHYFYQTCAETCGNISRFIQSFPLEEELTINPLIPKHVDHAKIMLANLEDHLTLYRGWPVIFFETTRDIKAGEQLGYSYGMNYWKNMQQHHNFTQSFFGEDGMPL